MVLTTPFDIKRIAITNPEVADATVVSPRELLIDGKSPGTISLIVWGVRARVQYDLEVDPGITTLQSEAAVVVPRRRHQRQRVRQAPWSSRARLDRTTSCFARRRSPRPARRITRSMNMLQLPGGETIQQVILQVRFAEVNHNALENLGRNSSRRATASPAVRRRASLPHRRLTRCRPGL